jgi:hypothetical protein
VSSPPTDFGRPVDAWAITPPTGDPAVPVPVVSYHYLGDLTPPSSVFPWGPLWSATTRPDNVATLLKDDDPNRLPLSAAVLSDDIVPSPQDVDRNGPLRPPVVFPDDASPVTTVELPSDHPTEVVPGLNQIAVPELGQTPLTPPEPTAFPTPAPEPSPTADPSVSEPHSESPDSPVDHDDDVTAEPPPVTELDTDKLLSEALVVTQDITSVAIVLTPTEVPPDSSTPAVPEPHDLAKSPTPSRPTSSHRWLTVAVVIVIAVITGLIWIGYHLAPGSDVERPLGSWPSGLTVTLSAHYATQEPVIDLALTVAASSSTGLAGELLLALPATTTNCPTVSLTTDSASLELTAWTGFDRPIDCAYRLSGLTVAAGTSQTFSLVVVNDQAANLDQWLDTVVTDTNTALAALTGAAFPLQRFSGLTVVADDVAASSGPAVVPYRVFATWTSGTPDTKQDLLLSNDTLPFQATEALLALTGGAGLDAVAVTTCDTARVEGRQVIAEPVPGPCFVDVSWGDFTSRGQFTVTP